jgi:hypothetical protein
LSVLGSGGTQTGGILASNDQLTVQAAFAEKGGTLNISGQGAVFDAAFTQSAGTIALSGSELTSETSFAQSGGVLDLGSTSVFDGSLSQTSFATIDETGGLLTGNGSFLENGGTLVLGGNGAVFNGAITFDAGLIEGANGQFTSNYSYTQAAGSLDLFGNGGVFHGPVSQSGGLIALFSGSLVSYGSFTESGGTLQLGDFGGTFNALTLESGAITSTAPTLQVNGVFSQTGGRMVFDGRDTTLAGPFSQTGGTIIVQSGALQLEGSGTLAGTITGAGKVLVQGGSTVISTTAVLGTAGIEVASGTLSFNGNETIKQVYTQYGTLAMGAHTLTLAGFASLDGEVAGASTVAVDGGGVFNGLSLDGTSRLYLASQVNQTGNISLGNATGSRTDLVIEKDGRLRMAGSFNVYDQSGNGTLTNAGNLLKTGGSQTGALFTNVTSTGTIGVNVGTLEFQGPSNAFGGTISGAGTFALGGNGQTSFAAGLSLTVHRVLLEMNAPGQLTLTHSLSYANEWSQQSGTLWLDGAGVVLTTGGPTGLDGGMVTGSGVLVTTANAAVNVDGIDFEGTATLNVYGKANETGSSSFGAQVGAAVSLNVESAATWTLENNANLGGANATITNDGVVQKLNGSANSTITGDFINAGTLEVANSTLTLSGSGTLGGTLTGGGQLALNGNYLLASGLAVSAGEIDIVGGVTSFGENLTDSGIWAQSGGSIALDGFTLTLAGLTTLEGGALNGLGTAVAKGATTIGDNFVVSLGTLAIAGQANQVGDITVGDLPNPPQGGTLPPSLATLQIDAGATYTVDDSNNISSNGTLAVAGTLSMQGGGQSVIGPSVVDTGTILAKSAALRFVGPVTGSGSIVIGAGGSLDFAGSVAASTTVSFAAAGGSIFLEDSAPGTNALTFNGSIAGFSANDFIEFANLNQNPGDISLALNSAGTVATISDTNGNSANITFTTAQSMSSLAIGVGSHGDIALFHT